MVSRYHWLSFPVDTSPLPDSSLITLLNHDYTIPAHATLKKVLFHNVQLGGMTNGNDYTYVPVWNCVSIVKIIYGPGSTRIIYRSGRRIPTYTTAYLAGLTNRYSSYISAGDLELGIDQKCSYGLSTDTVAWTVNVTIYMTELCRRQAVIWEPFATHFTGQCDLLYYL